MSLRRRFQSSSSSLPPAIPPVVVLLEGRDGSGKTTTARDVCAAAQVPCRIVALPPPSAAEQRSFYFQRWLNHLPEPGTIQLYDRSWYNRALVERVMGFSTREELERFFDDVPLVEESLLARGFALVKMFFTISHKEQARRLEGRRARGALSAVDKEALQRRDAYGRAEEEMFLRTSTATAPWVVLPESDRRARCAAVLDQIELAVARQRKRIGAEVSTIPGGRLPLGPSYA